MLYVSSNAEAYANVTGIEVGVFEDYLGKEVTHVNGEPVLDVLLQFAADEEWVSKDAMANFNSIMRFNSFSARLVVASDEYSLISDGFLF